MPSQHCSLTAIRSQETVVGTLCRAIFEIWIRTTEFSYCFNFYLIFTFNIYAILWVLVWSSVLLVVLCNILCLQVFLKYPSCPSREESAMSHWKENLGQNQNHAVPFESLVWNVIMSGFVNILIILGTCHSYPELPFWNNNNNKII